MYKIKMMGNEMLTVSQTEFAKINTIWKGDNYPPETKIGLSNGGTLLKKDIRGTRMDKKEIGKSKLGETRSEENKKELQEYIIARNEKLRLSPEERGKKTSMIGALYSAFTGLLNMPAELHDLVVAEQTEFFKNNQNRTQVSLVEYSKEGYEKAQKLMRVNNTTMTIGMAKTVVMMVEKAVAQDKYHASA